MTDGSSHYDSGGPAAAPARGFWTSPALRKLRRNPLAVTGFVIVLLFGLMALLAPLIAKPTGNCLRDLGMETQGQIYQPGFALKAIFASPPSATRWSA
ncbi:hypothetical protein MSS93_09025 [Deinococcus radiodurans]|nr:hypothetical protein MSS93_09025 [Deinococcus radiodurans]